MLLLTFGDDPAKIKGLKSSYTNIGLGKPYIDLFSKFEALKEFVHKIDPQEIIIFVDGYDVVQRRTDILNFESKFVESGFDIVFSAETYCWPNPWIAYQFAQVPLHSSCPVPYRFPNSGTFVGRAWAIKKMLEWDQFRINYDDQGYVHDFYLRNTQIKLGLDTQQILFQTGTGVRWSELDKCQAWFVHFNGKSHHKRDGTSVLEEYAAGKPIGGIPQFHNVPC
jgi:hypothetical protein